jgi:hypothetical protein
VHYILQIRPKQFAGILNFVCRKCKIINNN